MALPKKYRRSRNRLSNCIDNRIFRARFEGLLSWTHIDSGDSAVTTHSRQRITDNAAGMRSFGLAGAGVAILPEWLVRDDVAARRLLRLVPAYALPEQGVYAVYPNTRHLPVKVGMLIAFLREFIGSGKP